MAKSLRIFENKMYNNKTSIDDMYDHLIDQLETNGPIPLGTRLEQMLLNNNCFLQTIEYKRRDNLYYIFRIIKKTNLDNGIEKLELIHNQTTWLSKENYDKLFERILNSYIK